MKKIRVETGVIVKVRMKSKSYEAFDDSINCCDPPLNERDHTSLQRILGLIRRLIDNSVLVADSDKQPGWKFAQWEMKGVPVRLEVGPRDIENGQCVLVRRDTREKQFVKFEELATAIPAAMEALAKDLYDRALQNRENRTYSATTMDEVKQLAKEHTGFIKTMWCGDLACEEAMKADAGLSSRCMPFAQEHLSDVCPVCGKPAQKMVVWGVAY